jgi:hypothetical protein
VRYSESSNFEEVTDRRAQNIGYATFAVFAVSAAEELTQRKSKEKLACYIQEPK